MRTDGWSDGFKWVMDVIKSILVFGLVAMIATHTVDRDQTRREMRNLLAEREISSLGRAAERLFLASDNYFAVAYDSSAGNPQSKRADWSPSCADGQILASSKDRYENAYYDEFDRALQDIAGRYPSLEPLVMHVEETNKNMHESWKDSDKWDEFKGYRDETRAAVGLLVEALRESEDTCWDRFLENPGATVSARDCASEVTNSSLYPAIASK
ncbi:hypothetical protein [Ferrimonas marina]|uniref:Uncharacterized protein n=1 Tax=Ferrimonas marina TaxID=299255 RepID=A0A1M5UJE8_9GAMM|nr:hypothetical protein [Ferrimonas marina]SHH62956.1 hypothetical protein SAMN02745129_2595 [Ferrimonas marina]